jgi:methylphosphotriester-DNA--protein-cysteine methyltransferase
MTSTSERGPRQSKKNLYARLAELERIHEHIRRATEERSDQSSDTLLQKLQNIIDISGIERLPTESWFDVTARALGITSREMRAQLQTKAFDVTFSKWAAAREAEMEEIRQRLRLGPSSAGPADALSCPSKTDAPPTPLWGD